MTELSERRKADRARMADAVLALAKDFGIPAELEHPEHMPRAVVVKIKAPHGLRTHIEFDGDSPQPDTFVVPWFVDHEHRGVKLAACFGLPWGEVSRYHFGKCTAVAVGFDDLLAHLRDGFAAINSGEAFQPDSLAPATTGAAATTAI